MDLLVHLLMDKHINNLDLESYCVTKTFFNRYPELFNHLEGLLSDKKEFDVLYVGLGYGAEGVGCNHPFALMFLFEKLGIDYKMTLLDNYPKLVDAVKAQTEVRSIDPFEFIQFPTIRELTKKGDLYRAKLPVDYNYKVAVGEVNFVVDDLATMNVQKQYDLVVCLNVLQHLIEAANPYFHGIEALARRVNSSVFNLFNSVKPDGHLVVDEVYDDCKIPQCICPTERIIQYISPLIKPIYEECLCSDNPGVPKGSGENSYNIMVFKK